MEKFWKLIRITLFTILFSVSFPVSASGKHFMVEEEVMEIAEEIGEKYNICPEFLTSIAFYESSYCQEAKNGDCVGLMQVSAKWHKERMKHLGTTDIYDPYQNMLVASDYLHELFEKYEDPGMVLMVYNGDASAKDYWNGNAGLSKYALKILELSAELERKNGK